MYLPRHDGANLMRGDVFFAAHNGQGVHFVPLLNPNHVQHHLWRHRLQRCLCRHFLLRILKLSLRFSRRSLLRLPLHVQVFRKHPGLHA